jgi:hypothetical protein
MGGREGEREREREHKKGSSFDLLLPSPSPCPPPPISLSRARALLQVCWADIELYDLAKELMNKQLAFCRIKKSSVN